MTIFLDQEVYSDTPHLLHFIADLFKPRIDIVEIDCADPSSLRKAISGQSVKGSRTVVVFSESCSNPSGRIFAFETMAALKKEKEFASKVWFVIDNTWTTAVSVNPLTYGADFVIESTTKYISAGPSFPYSRLHLHQHPHSTL